MSNADILMGVIALLAYVFIVCPCLVGLIASDAKYLDAVKGGVMLTLVCVVIIVVAVACWSVVAYFTDSFRPNSPGTQFIEWVNAL